MDPVPPNQVQKGFFDEGTDRAGGKRKAPITAPDNAKSQSIGSHAWEVLRQWTHVNSMERFRPPPLEEPRQRVYVIRPVEDGMMQYSALPLHNSLAGILDYVTLVDPVQVTYDPIHVVNHMWNTGQPAEPPLDSQHEWYSWIIP